MRDWTHPRDDEGLSVSRPEMRDSGPLAVEPPEVTHVPSGPIWQLLCDLQPSPGRDP